MKKLLVVLTLLLSYNFSCSSVAFYGDNPAPSHEIWNTLLKKHVTKDGKVNYVGFKKDITALNTYLKLLSDNPPHEAKWTKNEQMAYWINAYNAFTVKLIIDYYPIKSIKDIGSLIKIPFVNTPWDIKFITIGNEKMDLNNIEHGQLRKKFNDPRIHFALVCASKSCPMLLNEAYISSTLDEQLTQQAKSFLKDKSRNNISENSLELSKIFDWYSMDFTSKNISIVDYLNKYAPVKINNNAKITYLEYSWDLNE